MARKRKYALTGIIIGLVAVIVLAASKSDVYAEISAGHGFQSPHLGHIGTP